MKRILIHIYVCLLAVIPTVGFSAVKIMPLGSSITIGETGGITDSAQLGGYRQYLWEKLDSANFDVEFIGSRQAGQAILPAFDVNHEAWKDKGAKFFADSIYSFLSVNTPDVILIHVGTYDTDTSTSVSVYNELLDEIDRYETDSAVDITVIIAQIINRSVTHTATSAFNDSIENMVAQRKVLGDNLILLDFESSIGFNYATDLYDTIRPNSSGYLKMAEGWFSVLDTLLQEDINITSQAKLSATDGNQYLYSITTTGNPLPSYQLLTSPSGMAIDGNGQITWTPTDTGSFNVSVRAYNSYSADNQSYSVKVYEGYCTSGMLHYWKFDDGTGTKASDSYGNADGALISNPLWKTNGIISNVLQFSGANNVDVSYNSDFDFSASGSFTVEAWVKFGFVGGSDDKVFVGRKNGTNNYWYIGAKGNAGNARFVVSSQPGQSVVVEGDFVNDLEWHHIVGVRDVSTNKCYLYVDGVADSSSAISFSTSFSSTEDINIAYLNGSGTPGNYYAGFIDEVAVYGTALSEQVIADHYTLINGGYHYCQYSGPVIQSQVAGINISEDGNRVIALTDLTVFDPNDTYPDDFTLSVDTGSNYSLSDFTVTPDENFDDTLYVPVQVNDGEFTSDTFIMVIPVVPFDDPPVVVNPIPNIVCNEDTSTITISIANVFNDVDNNNASITYQVLSTYDTNIVSATVNALSLEITPKLNKNGTTNIILQATSNTKSITDTLNITINAQDDAPVLANLVNQIISEGDTFASVDLDTILNEVDGDSILYNFTGNSELIINIDTINSIFQVIPPDINWFGAETIIIWAKDSTIAQLFDTIHVTFTVQPVDDNPSIKKAIKDTIVNEDAPAIIYNLSNNFTDIDNVDSNIVYNVQSISTTDVLNYSINKSILTLTPISDSNGVVTIVIKATSNALAVQDTFTIVVNSVDDYPDVTAIPKQTTFEDEVFDTVNLSNYLVEKDGDAVNWSYSQNTNVNVNFISSTEIIVEQSIPDWFGTDTIYIIFTDNTIAKLTDSVQVVFEILAVDDTPSIKAAIADIIVNEDAPNTAINLADVFTDVDNNDSLITYNISSNNNVALVATTINNKTLTLNYQDNAHGVAQIIVQATSNSQSARDTFMVTVNSVDDLPVLASIPAQTIQEGESFDTINLLSYLTENDGDTINWIYFGNTELNVNILATDELVVTTPDSNWFGTETISIVSQDSTANQYSDTVSVLFTVNAVDDAPYVVSTIADILVIEDHADTLIKLTDHIQDIDNNDNLISFTIQSNSNTGLLQTAISNDTLSLHFNANQNGQAQLILRALSNGKLLVDTFLVNVTAVDDYPVVSSISDISVQEGDSILPIELDTYLTNVDTDSIVWTVIDNVNITPIINNDILLFNIPDSNWYGTETWQIIATDFTVNEYSDTISLNIEVQNVDDDPYVANPITDKIIDEDTNIKIPLALVFGDIDNNVADITKTVAVNDLPTDLVTSIISQDTLYLTMKANTSGSASIIVTGTSNGRSVTDTYSLTVLPVDDYPVLTNIPNKTIVEGGSFANINLTDYLTELDGDSIVYNYLDNDELLVSISPSGIVEINMPDSNWFGQDTIIFKVTDFTANNYYDSTSVIFTVQAVDDAPYVLNAISDLNLTEDTTGITIYLTNVFDDVDNNNNDIILEIADNTNVAISSLDLVDKILSINLTANAYGTDSVIIRATSNGKTTTDTFKVNISAVDDAPVVGLIPDQTINEGGSFASINLDSYLTNHDIDSVIWSYIDASELTVTITDTNWAIIETPSVDWNGIDTIVFIATDDTPNNLADSASVIFKVDPEDDAPYVLNPLDSLIASEDTSLITIDISNVFDDIDNNNSGIIKFVSSNSNAALANAFIAGNNLFIDVNDNKNGSALIQIAGLSNGKIAIDTLSLVILPVDDSPSLLSIPPRSIDEGDIFNPINLNSYLNELDGDSVIWEATHSANFTSIVTDTNYWYIELVDSNWYGNEFIKLKVTDVTPDADSAIVFVSFTVNNVDDDPYVLNAISDTIINEDADVVKIPLPTVFSDIDNDDNLITKSLSVDVNLMVTTANITNDTLYINTVTNKHGSDTLIVIGTSNGRAVSDTFIVTVLPVDDYPVLAAPLNQTINEGGSFVSFELSTLLTEVDEDSITWSVLPSDYNISITPEGLVTIQTIHPDWFGSDTVSFVVTDFTANMYSDTATAIFVVQPVDDAPYVANPLANIIRNEDATADTIFIGDVFYDIDNDTSLLVETVLSNSNTSLLTATASNNQLVVTCLLNKHGTAQLVIRGSVGGKNAYDTVTVTVNAVDDAPVVSGIPEQTINEGSVFTIFDLDNYLIEVDSDTILWSYTNAGNLSVTIDTNNEAAIVPVDEDWFGTESITFTATDKTVNALFGEQEIVFTVEPVDDAPYVLNALSDLTVPEDTTVITINLLPVFDDIDNDNLNIIKTVKSNSNTDIITASVDTHDLKLTTKLNKHGTAIITLLATSNGKTVEEAFIIEIEPVDDYPELSGIPNQSINEDKNFTSFNLNDYLTEVDGDAVLWTYADTNELSVSLLDSVVNVKDPPKDWFGVDTITFIAYDNTVNQLSDSFKVIFTVNPVDDEPYVITPLPNIFRLEDAERIITPLRGRFGDIDNDLDDFVYSTNNSNSALIDVFLSNDTLYIDFLENKNSAPPSSAALVKVNATTNGKTTFSQFNVAVTPVNDAPSFTLSGNIEEFEGFSGTKLITVSPDPIPADELLQVVTYGISPSSVDFVNLSFNTSTGSASFTSVSGKTGSQVFTVTANDGQGVNNTYSDTFVVTINNKLAQSIEYDSVVEVQVDTDKIFLNATATSGLEVTYELISGLGEIIGDTLFIQGVGEIQIQISQPGNQFYQPAETVIQKIYVGKLEQTITFNAIADISYGEEFIILSASASSGLEVEFSLVGGDGKITEDTLYFDLPGQFTVKATQSGNVSYLAADSVVQIFEVLKLTQEIIFDTILNKEYISDPFKIHASSTSDLPVTYEVVSGNVILSNDTVAVTGVGSVTLKATQSGDNIYEPALPVERTFVIEKSNQYIQYLSDTTYKLEDSPVKLLAESSVGLPVTFSVDSGDALIVNDTLYVDKTGTVRIKILQEGNENYNEADTIVTISFGKANQVITFSLPDKMEYVEDLIIQLNGTASSGLPLSYSLIYGNATRLNNEIRVRGTGYIKICAYQYGNENYNAAEPVCDSINIYSEFVDLGILTIIEPDSSKEIKQNEPLNFNLLIKNFGELPVGEFTVRYNVNNGKLSGEKTYKSTILPGDTFNVYFDAQWVPRALSNSVCFSIENVTDDHVLANQLMCTQFDVIPSAIELHNIGEAKVYPNPVSNLVNFELPSGIRAGVIHIYDVHSRIVTMQKFAGFKNDNTVRLNVNYAHGIYFYKIISGEQYLSGKFIVE